MLLEDNWRGAAATRGLATRRLAAEGEYRHAAGLCDSFMRWWVVLLCAGGGFAPQQFTPEAELTQRDEGEPGKGDDHA